MYNVPQTSCSENAYLLLLPVARLASSLSSETVSYQCRLAVLAECFSCLVMLETFYHSFSSRRGEDFFERLVQEIAKDNISIVVEAARYEISIGEHSNLFDQCLAEYFPVFSFLAFDIVFEVWPFKLSVELQIKVVAETESVRSFLPWSWYVFFDEAHHLFVFLVSTPLVPKPQYHASAFCGSLGGE